VPVPLDPAVVEGPLWLRGPRPGDVVAEPTAGDEVEAVAPVEGVRASAMRAVVGIDEAIASLQAMRTHLLAGLGRLAIDEAVEARLDSGIAIRDLANELALQQRRSDRTVEAELSQAMDTVERWPATLRAWGEAAIGRGHVAVIAEIGAPLKSPEARAAFEDALLPHARSTSPGRLRAIARRELEALLEQPLTERHRTARDGREVTVTDLDDGMSILRALIPSVLAHGIHDRLTQMARAGAAADPDDPRTIGQRRADALCDLALTAEPTDTALRGIRAEVSIVIPGTVLLGGDTGADETGADETGGGDARLRSGQLVDPATARFLAGVTKLWTRVFTDPVKGHVVAVDGYRVPRKLRRILRERDQRCRWPGCTARAEHADIDHTIPWAEGGTTSIGNLAHLCRRHHMLKGAILAGGRHWSVRHLGHGVLEWTSPDGRTYVDEPDPVGPRFTESPSEWLWKGMIGPLPETPY
jgi:hypothetical protein